jgi:hypothetical protein
MGTAKFRINWLEPSSDTARRNSQARQILHVGDDSKKFKDRKGFPDAIAL